MRSTNHRNLVNVGILSGRIPLISLVQFIAVAEHLNFRHAAKALGISQSSVSARVKALEDNLGVLLFERHARGVRLTDAGRHFMERVTAGVDHICPLGHQLTRLRNGCVWRQIPASIGETVRGYVDDAENDERFIHGGFYNNNNRA